MLLQLILPIATLVLTTCYHAPESSAWQMLLLMTLQVRSATKRATTSKAGRTGVTSAVFSVDWVCVHGEGRLGQSWRNRVGGPGMGIYPDIGIGIQNLGSAVKAYCHKHLVG